MKKFTTFLCAVLCTIFTAKAQLQAQPIGEFVDLYTEGVQPKAISENGKWACGAALANSESSTSGYSNAVKWNLETGKTIYLQESEFEMSDAYWISNDGTLVGGSYLNQPAYNLNGEWIALDWPFVNLEGGQKTGEVNSIYFNGNDTICMGWIYTQTHAVLARWVNGTPDDEFSDVELNKYHNTTRPNNTKASQHMLRAVSADGSRMIVTLDRAINDPYGAYFSTTYVQYGDKVQIIERDFDERYEAASYVEEVVMSPNGKWACGDIFAFAKANSGVSSGHLAFLYDIDNDELTVFPPLPSGKMTTATAVDNNGNVYFRTIKDIVDFDPLGKPYIYKNNEYVELEKCLLAFKGILESDIDAIVKDEAEERDEDDLGHVWGVSADGKTLIGAGGSTKSNIWVAKLNNSPYNVSPVTAVENITYNKLNAFYSNGVISLTGNANMIEVYSITGSKVFTSNVENNSIEVNLNKGIYIVKAFAGSNISTSKIIVK